jgi:hypothetical protein
MESVEADASHTCSRRLTNAATPAVPPRPQPRFFTPSLPSTLAIATNCSELDNATPLLAHQTGGHAHHRSELEVGQSRHLLLRVRLPLSIRVPALGL